MYAKVRQNTKKSLGELSQKSTGKTEIQIVQIAGKNFNF